MMKILAAVASLALLGATTAPAFPPAPYHLVYGMARDQYGNPLTAGNVTILLETQTGVTLTAGVIPGLGAGVNYEIRVPMDAGLTSDLYQKNAQLYATPFRMYVGVGTTTNLPIQTITNSMALGKPSQSTRVDLTLGVDSNGDGIPDAWENAFLASLGLSVPLSSLHPNLDLAHDGRTLLQEFMLGDYPFDPGKPFDLTIIGMNDGSPVVQFPTMTGRSYTLLGSRDMKHWEPVSFYVAGDSRTHTFYYATSIGTVQAQVVPSDNASQGLFLKLLLQ